MKERKAGWSEEEDEARGVRILCTQAFGARAGRLMVTGRVGKKMLRPRVPSARGGSEQVGTVHFASRRAQGAWGSRKRDRNVKLDSDEKKSAYTPFIRLAANVKRLVAKIPGGGSRLGSFASALYLIKEKYNLPFTLISDSKKTIRKLFKVPNTFFGLMPGRVSYVIDKNGIIKGVFNSQFNPLSHISNTINCLKENVT